MKREHLIKKIKKKICLALNAWYWWHEGVGTTSAVKSRGISSALPYVPLLLSTTPYGQYICGTHTPPTYRFRLSTFFFKYFFGQLFRTRHTHTYIVTTDVDNMTLKFTIFGGPHPDWGSSTSFIRACSCKKSL